MVRVQVEVGARVGRLRVELDAGRTPYGGLVDGVQVVAVKWSMLMQVVVVQVVVGAWRDWWRVGRLASQS